MITYIPSKEEQLDVPENLNFIIYSLIAALRKAGAPDAELEHFVKLCRDHLNKVDRTEMEVMCKVIESRLRDGKTAPMANPLEGASELPDKDFV